jgi:hypothetical protein
MQPGEQRQILSGQVPALASAHSFLAAVQNAKAVAVNKENKENK